MAFNFQNGGHHSHNSQDQRRIDQQLSNITGQLFSFDINNQTETRQFNPPSGPRNQFNPPSGPRAGIQSRSRGSIQPRRNRSRFDPPVPRQSRADDSGDIEISGYQPGGRQTAKQVRRARDSEARQNIIKNKAPDSFKIAKSSSNKKNSNKKLQTKNRRQQQKQTLDAIHADPERTQARTLALQRLYTAAQKWHLAITHKEPLKEEVKQLARDLTHLTEKNYEELYADLCNVTNVQRYQFLIIDDFSGGIEETAALSSALNDINAGSVQDNAAAGDSTKGKKARELKRNAFLGIPTPKFNVNYSKTTQDTHEFKQIWKVARPLLSDLIVAVEEGRDINIARAYAPARQPTIELTKILRRTFEDIISEVVPTLTSEQIAKFEAPFLQVEEASKPKEPELPDFGGLSLSFNDVLDSMASAWGGADKAGATSGSGGFGGFARHHAASAGADDEEL